MTTKITSAQAHEEMSRLGDKVLQQDQFDREDIQSALEALGSGIGAEVPSGKSYLDWARREGLVETVSRGTYRWAVVTEQDAAEVGQEIAAGADLESNTIVATDMDPENPMILPEEDLPTEAFTDLISALAESFEEMGNEIQRTADMIQAQAQAYPEDLHLIIDDVPRLPRKLKKRMKRDLITHTSARKVTFSFAGADR